ncbi:MAG TPA: DUF817 domain-containing protein [Planctomycetota bacterium]
MREAAVEFLVFGLKQARACVFSGSFFLLLALSRVVDVPGLARYDVLFLGAIALQLILIATRLETVDEVKVIALFHLIGLALELFKTSPAIRSWSYPEPCVFRIAGVPLYSGFMYAAVGSYMCQAWRILDLELTDYPSYRISVPLAAAIYLNFFAHHWLPDVRWILVALVIAAFWRTGVLYTVTTPRRRMPLALSFLLIGFFVWVAENIATYFGAWSYPHQRGGWRPVGLGKIGSWGLLVILSFILVADLKHLKARRKVPAPAEA